MKKKKFELSNELVDITASSNNEAQRNTSTEQKEVGQGGTIANKDKHYEKSNLTLKVRSEFVKEFKLWCVSKDITMSNALEIMFSKYKNNL
jgi:hypothetical protein